MRHEAIGASPQMGAFLVSALYRALQIFGPDEVWPDIDSSVVPGQRLEKILTAFLSSLDANQAFDLMLKWLRGLTDREDQNIATEILLTVLTGLNETRPDDPRIKTLMTLTQPERTAAILSILGAKSDIAAFVSEAKEALLEVIQKIISGDPEIMAEVRESIKGMFTIGQNDTAKWMRVALLGFGGERLLIQVHSAIRLLCIKNGKVITKPEMRAVIEIAEKIFNLGGSKEDPGFETALPGWNLKLSRALGKKRLRFPGTKYNYRKSANSRNQFSEAGDINPRTGTEELAFAIERLFEELDRRIKRDPMKVFGDVMAGKLGNSLIVSVENDLRDRIDFLKAKKRDVEKEDYLEDNQEDLQEGETGHLTWDQISSRQEDIQRTVEETMTFEEIFNQLALTQIEKKVAILLSEGFTQHEIGKRLGKNQSWVSKKKKRIEQALREYLRQQHPV